MSGHKISVADSVPESLELLSQAADCAAPSKILAPSLKKYWISAFIQNYGHSDRLSTVLISEENKPRLLASLQFIGRDSVAFVGDGTSDYSDLLWNDPDVDILCTLLEHCFSQGVKEVVLSRLPGDSVSVPLLIAAGERLNLDRTGFLYHGE